MRRLVYVVAVGVLAALAGLAYLSSRVSDEAVQRAAAERVALLTGNRVEVRGATTISFFPLPRFEMRDVVLAPRFTEKSVSVASIDVMRGSVAVFPLLTGQVTLKDFILVRPRINLAVDRRGRPNWTRARRDDDDEELAEGNSDLGSGGASGEEPALQDAPLGSFRIRDGSLTYDSERTGTKQTITAIDATVSWARLGAPLAASGAVIWNGEAVRFDLAADTPLDFMNHGSSPTRIKFDSGVVDVDFEGKAHYTTDSQLEGTVTLSAPSARGLLRWIGTDLGAGPGLNAIDLSGTLNLIGKSLSLSDLSLNLDGNAAEGVVKVTLGENRTGLQGTLAVDVLDLGVYRTKTGNGDADPAATPETAMSTVVDLSVLNRVNVDLRVSAGSISYGDLVLGRSAGTITVRKGTIDLGVGEAELYGGMAQGTISAGPDPEGAQIKVALGISKTDIGPLLTALTGSARISGPTTARIDLSGTGRTVSDIVADLTGVAKLAISPGTIYGIDVEKLLTALETGSVEGWPSTTAATMLDELTATFAVTGGNAATENFFLKGPKIEVSADGEIRLVSASVAGHGTADLGEAAEGTSAVYSVPFAIEGPIANPTIYPDPIWLLNRPTATPDEIEKIRKDLQQSSPEDVIEDLVTRGRNMPPQVAPQTEQPSAPRQ